MRKVLVVGSLLAAFVVTQSAWGGVKKEEKAVEKSDNVLITTAKKAGITKCIPKLQELSNNLELDAVDYTLFDTYFTKDTNNRMYNVVIIKKYNDGTTSLASATVTPHGDDCDYSLQQIFTSTESCTDLRETTLKAWKFVRTVNDVIKLESEKGDIAFYLKPVGAGCMAFKTE